MHQLLIPATSISYLLNARNLTFSRSSTYGHSVHPTTGFLSANRLLHVAHFSTLSNGIKPTSVATRTTLARSSFNASLSVATSRCYSPRDTCYTANSRVNDPIEQPFVKQASLWNATRYASLLRLSTLLFLHGSKGNL